MTIIIGVVCSDGIVLASDSQTTTTDADYKRTNETKLHGFGFSGARVLIGGAGEMRFTDRAIEVFFERAAERTLRNPREVANLAEDAVRYVVDRYFVDDPTRPSEDSRNFSLMLGVWCQGLWMIFVVDSEAVAARELAYAATGSGESIAEYLLGRLYEGGCSVDEATRIAVYAIEEIKKFDVYCGGAIQSFVLRTTGVNRQPDPNIDEITRDLAESDAIHKAMWRMIARGPAFRDMFYQWIDKEREGRRKSKEDPPALPGSSDETPNR